MTTYYVPIENTRAPEAQRWFIAEFEAVDPIVALDMASHAFRRGRSNTGLVIWAAVRQCPTFEDMADLRLRMDACRYGGRSKGPARERAASSVAA